MAWLGYTFKMAKVFSFTWPTAGKSLRWYSNGLIEPSIPKYAHSDRPTARKEDKQKRVFHMAGWMRNTSGFGFPTNLKWETPTHPHRIHFFSFSFFFLFTKRILFHKPALMPHSTTTQTNMNNESVWHFFIFKHYTIKKKKSASDKFVDTKNRSDVNKVWSARALSWQWVWLFELWN